MEYSPYPPHGTHVASDLYPYPWTAFHSPHNGQPESPDPQTLPWLKPSTSKKLVCDSNLGTPRAGTPNMPDSAHNLSFNYTQSTCVGEHDGRCATAHKPWPPRPDYGTLQPMTSNSTTIFPHSTPIASAFVSTGGPLALRPMSPDGLTGENGVKSPQDLGLGMPYNAVFGDSQQTTRVVGSQGRKGILPSAPGYPAAPVAGTPAAKELFKPAKDADGKFPCPHCTRTYKNVKHLNRHLSYHTGERPFMCILCRATFSRSDTLKRHFQRCSIRRGNPTGASHLSHPEARVKRITETQKAFNK